MQTLIRRGAAVGTQQLHRQQTVVRRSSKQVRVMASSFYSLQAKDLEGQDVSFEKYTGKVVVITNVACFCGYTGRNYKELVELHEKYNSQGLEIVAFPCNQFGAQEPGSPAEIRKFVTDRNVAFDVMAKIDVNGPSTHPVYQYLKAACDTCAGDVRWNFAAKFIVDRQGNVVSRASGDPKASEALLVELLGQQ